MTDLYYIRYEICVSILIFSICILSWKKSKYIMGNYFSNGVSEEEQEVLTAQPESKRQRCADEGVLTRSRVKANRGLKILVDEDFIKNEEMKPEKSITSKPRVSNRIMENPLDPLLKLEKLVSEMHNRKRKPFVIEDVNDVTWGVAQKQQRSHEDRYQAKQFGPFKFFAVFDGHGGTYKMDKDHIGDHCVEHLHEKLASALEGIDLNDEVDVAYNISKTFVDFDILLKATGKLYGSTCTAVLVDTVRKLIYQVNLGDSRSIVFTNEKIISSTLDHTPTTEAKRITDAGGKIRYGRMMNDKFLLSVSRSFGDFDFKRCYGDSSETYNPTEGMSSSLPDIKMNSYLPVPHRLRSQNLIRHSLRSRLTLGTHVILSSDAPFEHNVFDNQRLIDMFINSDSEDYNEIANEMVSSIIQKTNDDTTVMVLTL